jgi:hypothetical protein
MAGATAGRLPQSETPIVASEAGAMSGLDHRTLMVGDHGGTPASTTGSVKPGYFQHYPATTSPGSASGATGSVFGSSGSVLGAMQATTIEPSPNAPSHVVDFLSEPRATYEKIARNLALPIMDGPQGDHFLFSEALKFEPATRRRGPEVRRYTQLNVVALNLILAMQRGRVAPTAHQIMENYGFEGTVLTETGKEEMFYDGEVGAERAFNCVLRGPAKTHNVFGQNIRCGTPLFIIVKKERIDDRGYVVDAMKAPMFARDLATGSTHAFQVSFFGNREYVTPPLSALRYTDEHGLTCYGTYRRIGVAGNTTTPYIPDRYLKAAPYSMEAILALPKFKILIDHGSW